MSGRPRGPAAQVPTYWLSGRRPVAAALRAGRALRIAVADGAGGLDELLSAAAERRVPVQRMPRAALDRLADEEAHGCAAEVRPPAPTDLGELLARVPGRQRALLLACDHLQDPQNLGAVARTAEAVGAAGLILPDRRAAGVTAAAERASAGALAALPHAVVHNLSWALDRCREAGFWIYGAAADGAVDYAEADFASRTVLVIGAEGSGLGQVVRKRCDRLVRLPLWGGVESLNAAVAAGVLMYEWARTAARPVRAAGAFRPLTTQSLYD